ncbi:hypothetical protein KFE96_10260 [Kordiimonas sp. SCSIO 12603]|uniref:hypothetical protein n=1 Tax=Kordiimonas sp. SCSIO 12603 TaxID=2829596 RepID=UPI002104F282|nr:hypothetical protein [Kordiimonas sp. SCSIO 12603]UTW57247.1 hypothetical protein KFE96_10260 [Kordiimonas sp. SCSIO 12603]
MFSNAVKSACLTATFLFTAAIEAQDTKTPEQTAIEKLEFLVGEWEGPGISYRQDGRESQYHDKESVWFDVQNSLLIIQARGFRDGRQTYGLHTVINYDAEAGHYWYNPYTSKGVSRPFKCVLEAKEFKCRVEDGSYRLTFRRTEDGSWNEFGERKTEAGWQKNFETILKAAPSK